MKLSIIALLCISTLTIALDMNGVVDSVDKKKAKEAVNQDTAIASAMSGDISVKALKESVDTKKAKEAVDKDKLVKSLY